jgi:hypothetical protein
VQTKALGGFLNSRLVSRQRQTVVSLAPFQLVESIKERVDSGEGVGMPRAIH